MIFVLAALAASPAWADRQPPQAPTGSGKPATSIKIDDPTLYAPADDSSWYLRGDVGVDVPVAGAAGFGVGVGHLGDYVFFGGAFRFYGMRYGAVRVYQPGTSGLLVNKGSEVGRQRSDSDTSTMFSLGPEIGFMMKLFGSDKWVESGRFSLAYAQYQDTTNSLSMRGALAEFHAEVGYKLTESITLAPGVTYYLGYTRRTGATVSTAFESNNFLPIQWWSWQGALYVWF
ncbi:MAG: hypothetical protein HY075_10910 [Deltaproteobacteria bacterium]|nr:hypothetical protein [Deltaproteobacteria bacterium]